MSTCESQVELLITMKWMENMTPTKRRQTWNTHLYWQIKPLWNKLRKGNQVTQRSSRMPMNPAQAASEPCTRSTERRANRERNIVEAVVTWEPKIRAESGTAITACHFQSPLHTYQDIQVVQDILKVSSWQPSRRHGCNSAIGMKKKTKPHP